jgi:hypothetical protein
MNIDAVELGNLAAAGWRAKVADTVAEPLSSVAPLERDQARALVGATFFVLALVYVIQTSRRAAQELRG